MCDDEQEARPKPEPIAGTSGAEEPLWGGEVTQDGEILWQRPGIPLGFNPKPNEFYPDGKPILDDELLPAALKWAMLFEQRDGERIVGQNKTVYGEKLSTVWLGLDHNFSHDGPPIIFETMLFAPVDGMTLREWVFAYANKTLTPEQDEAYSQHCAFIAKHYPHDQLQLRYSTREEAAAMHRRLRWQTLIPPTWRAYLLGRLAGIDHWRIDA